LIRVDRARSLPPVLTLANEGDDRINVSLAETFNRWYGSEVPVMGGGTDENCDLERTVAMVTRLIDD
jgi:hypothetical protein